ncbi:glutathione synthase [Ectothiorhodospira variabilis]|uniref:glutathione synthase n=1 Tax=Ectothiorhodospira variabilis TaxID=505694 RepID=UPI001EFA6960|nr:glutathione synthase [Ectothiorhodospira variabilis]MCG5494599.1 glutathione synthase [Ectothiorhodospira variabilis]MCG5503590.1 glutathione synthase [Ectothiorhodospira variabilis]MCG5506695.1 glutathione synthase [Ectothiorhodospira variabilis]
MNGTDIRLGVVMDPIAGIQVKKDSTLAMLLAAQSRGWHLHYLEQGDLWLEDGRVLASSRPLAVRDDPMHWYELDEAGTHPLADLDVILMRKDPPFDMEYIYTTYLLELAMAEGCHVVNHPASLRDANEKLFTAWFPQCCPPTLVSRDPGRIREFMAHQGDIVVKPLDGMGGVSVFRLTPGDSNTGVILETMTQRGTRTVMAQRFLPEYRQGDKRILLIDGEPVPYALARIPAEGENRANLAVGGRGEGLALSDRDQWICQQVGPRLKEKGLTFVGLDVIGDYLTEINVTSPTCIRELDTLFGLDIGDQLMGAIARKLEAEA